jgi:hypothetical protein
LSGTKVDLSTGVDDEDLVELLVDALSRLVKRDERRHLEDVRKDSKALGVVKSGRGVEPSGGVVPRCDTSSRSHHLSDGDSLPLSTGNSSDELVADLGVLGVDDVEHLEATCERRNESAALPMRFERREKKKKNVQNVLHGFSEF